MVIKSSAYLNTYTHTHTYIYTNFIIANKKYSSN